VYEVCSTWEGPYSSLIPLLFRAAMMNILSCVHDTPLVLPSIPINFLNTFDLIFMLMTYPTPDYIRSTIPSLNPQSPTLHLPGLVVSITTILLGRHTHTLQGEKVGEDANRPSRGEHSLVDAPLILHYLLWPGCEADQGDPGGGGLGTATRKSGPAAFCTGIQKPFSF
jgi:hypothetical protein